MGGTRNGGRGTRWWRRFPLARAVLFALFTLPAARVTLPAQNPSLRWLTIRTEHFFVHFTAPTEGLARRVAADAERAYAQLSKQIHPPRGMIDVVISDDVDVSNGSATPYPTNRIVIYANPPVTESALRYTNDWAQLVMTHELTHIFHLDRTRGIWSLGQHVFGRAAALFPNFYNPSWLTEGIAVYEESRLAGAGRIQGSEHRMIARAAAVDHSFPSIGAISSAYGRFPFGESAYAFGSLFVDYLARTQGESRIGTFVDKSAATLIPYLLDVPGRQAFGTTFTRAWRGFTDSVARSIRVAPVAPLPAWEELTRDGVYVFAPRWISDSAIVYAGSPGRESFGAFRVDLDGRRRRIGRRNSRSANVPLADGGFLYSQVDFTNPYTQRSDLWIQRGTREHQLTFGQRLTTPDARADGEIVAEQIVPGATRLVRVSPDGSRITPLTSGSYDEQWTEPRWSHAGDYIVASRWLRGNISQIVILDTLGRIVHTVSSGTSVEATPSWLRDDRGILFSSDRTGSAQLYVQEFTRRDGFSEPRTFRLSDVETGLFEPNAAPNAPKISSVLFRADGYHLGVGSCCATGSGANDSRALERVEPYLDTVPRGPVAPVVSETSAVRSFSPWRTLIPRYWLPNLDDGIDGGYRIGASTSGIDVIGRHAISANLAVPTNDRGGITGSVAYQYAGLGLPVIQLDASQDWQTLGGIFARDPQRHLIGELFRRTRNADALATWVRQRYRTVVTVSGGAGLERWSHVTTPAGLIPSIDTTGQFGTLDFPQLIAGASFANYQRPPFSISPEDGVSLNVTARDRLSSGLTASGPQSLSVVGTASVYKSLNLPGFAHHVFALRGAGGWADVNTNGYFSVGGVSGTTFEIIPGYVLGEGRRTFPVRGFAGGTLLGTRAVTGSAEYRIPLLLFGGAPGVLPFFFDRTSLTLFGDYGKAWCPNVRAGRQVCNQAGQDQGLDIGSVGAELNLNFGVFSWDTPTRFRVGVVHPMENGALFGRSKTQLYFVSGVSF